MYKVIITVAIAASVLSGCISSKYIKTDQIIVNQLETAQGSQTVVEKVVRRAAKDVIEKSTNVTSVTRVTDFNKGGKKEKNGIKVPGQIDIEPSGKKLLFEAYENTNSKDVMSNLWTIATDGTGMTKVTQGKYWDLDPVYSPDGKYIYFSSNRGDSKPKIWRVYATGVGGMTRITSSYTSDRMPTLSPTGDLLSYQALLPDTNEWQVWTVNTNGSLPTQLLTGTTPVFSPDGNMVLYSTQNSDTQKFDIWMMKADGTNQTQLTQGDADCLQPRWSPDGKKILYASNKGLDEDRNENFDIWMMNVDGTNITQLTTNGSQDDTPIFDPNGKYIYFRTNRGGTWDIWRMELLTDKR